MTEKIICSEYTGAEHTPTKDITINDLIKRQMMFIDKFLVLLAKRDESLIKPLLQKYEKILNDLKISSQKNKSTERFTSDYTDFKWVMKNSDYIPLIENSVLYFLNLTKYKDQISEENKVVVLMPDAIRADFHPLYYLVFSLIEIISRETTLEIAKQFIDFYHESNKSNYEKLETIDDYAKSLFKGGCPKNQNYIRLVQDGRFYLKVTYCIWGEVYADLPDLELAYNLECYGDHSVLPYINPNFKLSRTKTLVEGLPYCDFIFYDKRNDTEIEHPDEGFWKNF